nr:adenosine deaminase [Anaerolineae bacterium]
MDYRHNNPTQDDVDPLYAYLKPLPKIELHRHLEGSLRLGTMADIAREYHLDLPGYEVEQFRNLVQMMPDDPPTADMFISKFGTLRKFYRSPEIIQRVAYEAVIDAALDNVIYLELRFTPIALGRIKRYPLTDVTDWVISAVDQAKAEAGIDVGLIISMNRHESVELGDKFVDIAIDNQDRGIVGIDLAGAENHYPGKPFERVFRKAHEAGLNVTIHAGEWAGPESVLEAIHVLGAQRLGHGVRIIEAPDVMALVRDRGIALEVCPTSNLQSGVTPALEKHPLPYLYAEGLLTTLNTDDPGVSGIDLTDEYVVAMRHFDFSLQDIKQHVLNAAQVAFLAEAARQSLADRLSAAYDLVEGTA